MNVIAVPGLMCYISLEEIATSGDLRSMYGFIYITENLITGNKYIGKHRANNISDHRYLGSGINIRRAIKKYGRENFDRKILGIAETKEELDVMEIALIVEYDAIKNSHFYNINKGGGSSSPLTLEQLTNLSTKVRQRWEEMVPEERTRLAELCRQAHLGKPKSPEHRAKISAAKLGISHWTPESLASMIEKRKAQIAMGIGVPPIGNRGNKDFLHDEEGRRKIKIGVWQARNRIFEQRNSYKTEEGKIATREKLAIYYTDEQRLDHGQKVREARARKKADLAANGLEPVKHRWFHNPLNPKQRLYLPMTDRVPRGWVAGKGKTGARTVDHAKVIELIHAGLRNSEIARQVGCTASTVWQIRHELESK